MNDVFRPMMGKCKDAPKCFSRRGACTPQTKGLLREAAPEVVKICAEKFFWLLCKDKKIPCTHIQEVPGKKTPDFSISLSSGDRDYEVAVEVKFRGLSDPLHTKLTQAASAGDGMLYVSDATKFDRRGEASIGGTVFSYKDKTDNTLTGCAGVPQAEEGTSVEQDRFSRQTWPSAQVPDASKQLRNYSDEGVLTLLLLCYSFNDAEAFQECIHLRGLAKEGRRISFAGSAEPETGVRISPSDPGAVKGLEHISAVATLLGDGSGCIYPCSDARKKWPSNLKIDGFSLCDPDSWDLATSWF